MLRLSNSYERVKTWLLDSGLHISDENDENCGAVHSFFDEEKNEFGFLYPEITGYFISTLQFLHSVEKNTQYQKLAKLSANWLLKIYDKYGAIIQGISSDSSKQNLAYSFDTAICAKGILDCYNLTGEEKYLEYAKKMANFILESTNDDGTVKPFKNIEKNQFEENSALWYQKKGCFHIKTSMALLQLYEINKDKKLLESACNICDTYSIFQNHDGSFSLHQNEKVINLHTLCYALEGLLFAFSVTNQEKYLQSCNDAVRWSIKQIHDDGSIDLWFNSKYKSRAAYPISQLIRIMILLNKLDNRYSYQKHIEKLISYLLSLQAENPSNVIDGGFYEEFYKSIFGWKKRLKINSWTSMFALQALYWFDNQEKITYENAIKYLF